MWGDTYVARKGDGTCSGCAADRDDKLCIDGILEANKNSCVRGDEQYVIWLRKDQAELNQFFGKPITTQILESTPEEEEAWQTAQKKVATGVTDGPAMRGQLPLFPEIEPVPVEDYIKAIGTDPLDVQVGGGHYKDLKIQPVEYIHANKLDYCEANVVKYITRWRDKGGKKDLEKAKHYIDLLIQLEGL